MTKEKAIIDNLNDERVATLVEKETLEDKRIILPRMGRLENYENQDIIMCYGKDVKEKIQNVQRRLEDEILDLSILEENKDLNVTEVVERALDEVTKIFNEEIGEGLL